MTVEDTEILSVTEIYATIQGEGTHAGRPTTLVRLAGCELRCRWCDTDYARAGGEPRTVSEVVEAVLAFGCPSVLVTGGEPLLQGAAPTLCRRLVEIGLRVLLETSGAYDISAVDPRVHRVVDVKCPDSGESGRNLWSNVRHLTPRDELKFVIASREDYRWALRTIEDHGLLARCPVVFGAVSGRLDPQDLAGWLLEDRLDVRMQLQLHKILWPGETGV